MSYSATTTTIPLTNLSQPQSSNNANILGTNSNVPHTSSTSSSLPSSQQITAGGSSNGSLAVNNAPTTATTAATNANRTQRLPNHSTRPLTWIEQLAKSLSLANGLGTMALIAAFIFGIGAWVGMKVQISQGGKSMELAIWTACADHEMIQNSSLCQSIMAKDFSSEFTKRDDILPKHQEVTVVMKRDYVGEEEAPSDLSPKKKPSAIKPSPYQTLLSSLSPIDQSLIDGSLPNDYPSSKLYYEFDPAIRATIFPLVHLLTSPLHWLFDFIESLLLLTVYCLHKLLSWSTSIVLILLQAFIYNYIEQLIKSLFAVVDAVIAEAIMPSWMPFILTGNLASVLGLSALRSFWYGADYLESLKWIFGFRVGMWVLVEVVKAAWGLWQRWDEIADRRRRVRSESRDRNLNQNQTPDYYQQSDLLSGSAGRRHAWLTNSSAN